ncbi:MAG: dihydroorotate dehydrogenase [Methanomicrobiales archaeon]|nr:dihydroorotate dehydrogenase [Methanomicrobiales archaeon]MDD1647259.1 dihydroorotate dehydrogenase [Methanomicrobiales archaeon]
MIRLVPGTVSLGGVEMANHLVLAAGILGTTGSSIRRVLEAGAGAAVTKSIGPVASAGHPGPCVVELGDGLLNAMGLPNPSREFGTELASLKGLPVVASVFGGTPEEFRKVASWFRDRVAGFELNLSCPHAEGYGAAIGTDPGTVEECTRAVASLGLPTWVKLTPNVTDLPVIGQAAQRGGATAVVAVNTVRAMRISTELRLPVLGNRYGGLSGRAIFPIAVRCVYELYESVEIPVIGVGGIATAEDVIEMMMAGASAVQIGSAVRENPGIFREIAGELYRPGGVSPEEIVGCAHG